MPSMQNVLVLTMPNTRTYKINTDFNSSSMVRMSPHISAAALPLLPLHVFHMLRTFFPTVSPRFGCLIPSPIGTPLKIQACIFPRFKILNITFKIDNMVPMSG